MSERLAGLLLHPTSLPGRHGIGELGAEATAFLDFLHEAGVRLWQVLPLGPTGYGDSPYQCFSAFAGNPLLISLDRLAEQGLLAAADLANGAGLPGARGRLRPGDRVQAAAAREGLRGLREDGRGRPARVARGLPRGAAPPGWTTSRCSWRSRPATAAPPGHLGPRAASTRDPRRPGARPARSSPGEIRGAEFEQWLFFEQWAAVREQAHARGIQIMGDIPIFVAHDSADVWAHPELFHLAADGRPSFVAGVPPDYFSATGQLWGNPLYRWDALARSGYAWWIDRFRAVLALVDLVRLDHFRGFEAYWEVPGDAPTAVDGQWVKGPGRAPSSRRCSGAFGTLPIVAEDLGVITPEVEALRDRFGFPGMAILQFAFGSDAHANDFLPHNYPKNTVVYTGTHDNDTVVGWWTAGVGDTTRTQAEVDREHARALAYVGGDGSRDPLGLHPRPVRLGGRHGDRAAAGRARPGQRAPA